MAALVQVLQTLVRIEVLREVGVESGNTATGAEPSLSRRSTVAQPSSNRVDTV